MKNNFFYADIQTHYKHFHEHDRASIKEVCEQFLFDRVRMQKYDRQKTGKMYKNKRNIVRQEAVSTDYQNNMCKKNAQVALEWG